MTSELVRICVIVIIGDLAHSMIRRVLYRRARSKKTAKPLTA
jgi:hypothetical protein